MTDKIKIHTEFEQLDDGIYFQLPEDQYHAQKRISSSGIQSLLISPGTFWHRSPLNPDYAKNEAKRDPMARIIGRAYHTARLEPSMMDNRFAREPHVSEFEGVLATDAAVKKELKAMGEAQTKSGELALARAYRLKEVGYEGDIFSIIMHEFKESLDGREAVPAEVWDDIIRDGERLRSCEAVCEILYNGGSDCGHEVSVFWTDKEGNKYKCRFDKILPDRFIDLKTFANSMGKELMQNLNDAFQYNRYYIQGSHYFNGSEVVRTSDLPVIGNAEEKALIKSIRANPLPLQPYFLFQEKGGIPNILMKRYRIFNIHYSDADADHMGVDNLYELAVHHNHRSAIYMKAEVEIQQAVKQYNRYMEVYGENEPWFPLDNAVTDFDDLDFNPYWLGVK